MFIKEKVPAEFKDAVVKFCTVDSDVPPAVDVETDCGVCDVETKSAAIVLAPVAQWKCAAGRAVSYGLCLGRAPKIVLLGVPEEAEVIKILSWTAQYRVICEIWNSSEWSLPVEDNYALVSGDRRRFQRKRRVGSKYWDTSAGDLGD
ncbi:MAG TPA: hypothetical protein V6D29_06805 [Leptolyngbyaceae cyanobacterium]